MQQRYQQIGIKLCCAYIRFESFHMSLNLSLSYHLLNQPSIILQSSCLFFRSLLRYNALLYCMIQCCTALLCIVLYCTVLLCKVLYCTVLHCTALHCTAMQGTVLYCYARYCTVLHCYARYCTVLICKVLYRGFDGTKFCAQVSIYLLFIHICETLKFLRV